MFSVGTEESGGKNVPVVFIFSHSAKQVTGAQFLLPAKESGLFSSLPFASPLLL